MANKALSAAQLQKQVADLQAALASSEKLAADRGRLLEYVANLLLEIQNKFSNSPVLTNLPKKVNFWWLLTNWRAVLEFIEFVVLKIKEFIKNVKVQPNPDAAAQ